MHIFHVPNICQAFLQVVWDKTVNIADKSPYLQGFYILAVLVGGGDKDDK